MSGYVPLPDIFDEDRTREAMAQKIAEHHSPPPRPSRTLGGWRKSLAPDLLAALLPAR